jgi:hypothetical protein
VADLDGTGRKDLVFACYHNGSGHATPSLVYLGGTSGWSSSPDIQLPTEGAADVKAAKLVKPGSGGYMSKTITVENAREMGSFHTLRCDATLGASQSGRVQLIDADTFEVLDETPLENGLNEWSLEDSFRVRDHPSIRVVVLAEGLDKAGAFELDNLWLNWTLRERTPPVVLGLEVSESSVYRLQSIDLWVNATDEFDLVEELRVRVEHALNGTSDWQTYLLDSPEYDFGRGAWKVPLRPRVTAEPGLYDLRVMAFDVDNEHSEWMVFPGMVEVLNNLPTAPVVRIEPQEAVTTSTLRVEVETGSTDVESTGLTYRYLWYRDGAVMPNITTDSVPFSSTSKGQNWSVEVRAFDGDDEGLPGTAWRIIKNAAPRPKDDLPDPDLLEDTIDENWLNLATAFEDPDGDLLTWSLESTPEHMEITIDPTTGKVTITPNPDWSGDETITFVATDGELTASQTVTVLVLAVNDLPWFDSVDGVAVTSDLIKYFIKQDEELVIRYTVSDVEGDEVLAMVNTSAVELDEEAGEIRFTPDNDAVGTLRFGLRIWDVESPDDRVTLDFEITVENVNDPMDDPSITKPSEGEKFEVNETFGLLGVCTDPDTQYDQVLNYSWSSNLSGHLGYGSSLGISLKDDGIHVITLTVTDGEFTKTATVTIEVEAEPIIEPPPPNGNGGEEEELPYSLIVGLVVALVVVGAVFYVLSTRKKTEEAEAADEAEYKREHMERAREAVKAAADHLEAEQEEAPPEKIVYEEIKTGTTPDGTLSMQATVTEAPSADTARLFTGVATEPAMTDEEREQLHLDNLKRKYQTAIGRLPYGIPSDELKGREWVDLAAALATGEKKTSPQGQELTNIEGRWYYSDVKDTGTFLKEHGAKPKREPPKKKEVAVATDKAALLAKLEERFILGEISEETYNRLVDKYSEEN